MDGLSRAGAIASESTHLLRSLVAAEARHHGENGKIDLFASGDKTVVPRFFARHAEPTAEAPEGREHVCATQRGGVALPSLLEEDKEKIRQT